MDDASDVTTTSLSGAVKLLAVVAIGGLSYWIGGEAGVYVFLALMALAAAAFCALLLSGWAMETDPWKKFDA